MADNDIILGNSRSSETEKGLGITKKMIFNQSFFLLFSFILLSFSLVSWFSPNVKNSISEFNDKFIVADPDVVFATGSFIKKGMLIFDQANGLYSIPPTMLFIFVIPLAVSVSAIIISILLTVGLIKTGDYRKRMSLYRSIVWIQLIFIFLLFLSFILISLSSAPYANNIIVSFKKGSFNLYIEEVPSGLFENRPNILWLTTKMLGVDPENVDSSNMAAFKIKVLIVIFLIPGMQILFNLFGEILALASRGHFINSDDVVREVKSKKIRKNKNKDEEEEYDEFDDINSYYNSNKSDLSPREQKREEKLKAKEERLAEKEQLRAEKEAYKEERHAEKERAKEERLVEKEGSRDKKSTPKKDKRSNFDETYEVNYDRDILSESYDDDDDVLISQGFESLGGGKALGDLNKFDHKPQSSFEDELLNIPISNIESETILADELMNSIKPEFASMKNVDKYILNKQDHNKLFDYKFNDPISNRPVNFRNFDDFTEMDANTSEVKEVMENMELDNSSKQSFGITPFNSDLSQTINTNAIKKSTTTAAPLKIAQNNVASNPQQTQQVQQQNNVNPNPQQQNVKANIDPFGNPAPKPEVINPKKILSFLFNMTKLIDFTQGRDCASFKKFFVTLNNFNDNKLTDNFQNLTEGIKEYIDFAFSYDNKFVNLILNIMKKNEKIFGNYSETVKKALLSYKNNVLEWNYYDAFLDIQKVFIITSGNLEILSKTGFCIKYRLLNNFSYLEKKFGYINQLNQLRDKGEYKEYRKKCIEIMHKMSPEKNSFIKFTREFFGD